MGGIALNNDMLNSVQMKGLTNLLWTFQGRIEENLIKQFRNLIRVFNLSK